MLRTDRLKELACAAIDEKASEIIDGAKDILAHPEPGYSETRTEQVVAKKFTDLGIQHKQGLALTGVKGRFSGGAGPGTKVAILGELDSLLVSEHPHADSETTAAHACGHHCQIGMMLGATMGLMTPQVLENLKGEIIPFAGPAEEFIEVERRLQLRDEGKV